MDVIDTVVRMLATLSLVAAATLVVFVVSAVWVRFGTPPNAATSLVAAGREWGLWLAAVVAVVMLTGSLFLSEVANFTPCVLCWYQRIAAYPLAVLLVIAALRKDRQIWVYVLPFTVVGSAVALWHLAIERIDAFSDSAVCEVGASCSVRWVWEFGFVSIPFMALIGFLCITAAVLAARRPAPTAAA